MKAETGLVLAVLSLQQALISASDDNYPLKPVTTRKHCLMWTPELQSLRRTVRRTFNNCRTDRNPQSWEVGTEAHRRYRRKVRKASKMREELPVTPLMTYPNRLGYTGLLLGTLSSS
jgi:hypothetical protein